MIKIIADNDSAPIRIDRFVKYLYPNLTQGVIERALRKMDIMINDARAASNARVNNQDVVSIAKYLEKYSTNNSKLPKNYETPAIIDLANKLITNYKILEAEEFFLINKPSSIPTQGGTKILCSIDCALKYLNKKGNDFRLVHRLDKATSGLLLIAKNRQTAIKLTKAFGEKEIEKEYLAILQGIPANNRGQIVSNLVKIKYKVHLNKENTEGKNSVTNYLVKAIDTKNQLSLVIFKPITGRTHQLRVHSQELNCSILGDQKYGNSNTSNSPTKIFLHALQLKIPAHIFGKEYKLLAKLPNEFTENIRKYFKNSIYCLNKEYPNLIK